MAYEPYEKQTWVDGTTPIDAEHMNHIEDGIYNSVPKDSIGGAAIVGETDTAMFNGEFTVNTIQEAEYAAPHALSSVTGRLPQNYLYKVTFDGEQYVLPVSLSFVIRDDMLKVFEYIGKLSLRTADDASGLTHVDPNVPFLIISDLGEHNSIDVFTEIAGEHTFSVERIEFNGTMLPRFLMYGGQYFPMEFIVTSSTYTGVSIGANKLHSTKETVAIGNGNSIYGDMCHAIGTGNVLNSTGANDVFGRSNTIISPYALIVGSYNNVSGQNAHAFGTRNNISGQHGFAFGRDNNVSGVMSQAMGYKNNASGKFATAIGNGSLANHLSQYAIGSYNEADPSEAAADERGNYLEIVGNGVDADNRSNARTLDWDGNESLSGGITLGKGTADEVTLSAAQLKQLLAMLN